MKNNRLAADGSRLIVALDTPSLDMVKKLIKELMGIVTFYKIGSELFTAHGWEAVTLVRKAGGRIFLDLKLHDIPNTVSKAAAVICEHEIEMFNVHGLGGFEMMKKTRESVDGRVKIGTKRPAILAVTVLTSHSKAELSKELGITKTLKDEVLLLARLAKKAGLNGVVASPHETAMLRKEFPSEFLIVTPGIRPAGSAKNDQERVFTPKEAFAAGADYIVVGRPIVAASDPRKQALSIVGSLA